MTTPRFFATGFSTALSFRGIGAVVYLCTTALALIPALSLRAALTEALGASAAGLDLSHGFNFTVVGDLLQMHGSALTASIASIGPLLVLFLVVNLFLTGGVIAAARNQDGSVQEFFHSAAHYFGRMFRFELIAGVFALFALLVVVLGLTFLHGAITAGATSEWPSVWAILVDALVVAVLLFVFSLVVDYGRIAIIVEEEQSAWRGFLRGLALLWSARLPAASLSFAFLVVFGLVGAGVVVVSGLLDGEAGVLLAALVLVQQVWILLRVLLRLAATTAETRLYEEFSFVPFHMARTEG